MWSLLVWHNTISSLQVNENYAGKYDIRNEFFSRSSLISNSVILTIVILHVFGSPPRRVSPDHSSIDGYGISIWFQVQSNVSFKKKKRKKKYISRTWKKKRKHLFGALQITSTHTPHFFLFSYLSFRKIHARGHSRYSILFLKRTTSGIRRYLLITTFRYFIRMIYITSSILSCPRTPHPFLSHSRSPVFLPNLFTYLLFCCTFFRQYSNALTLYTSFLAGPWRKRAGCWPD